MTPVITPLVACNVTGGTKAWRRHGLGIDRRTA